MDGSQSPILGRRKDVDDSLLEDGPGSQKRLKRLLTQESDLKVGFNEYGGHDELIEASINCVRSTCSTVVSKLNTRYVFVSSESPSF